MKIFVPTKAGILSFEHTKHAEAADKIEGLSRHSFSITYLRGQNHWR